MNLKSIALGAATFVMLAGSARAQNYTITLYSGQNGGGNVVMTYTGPMLNLTQSGSPVSGFSINPAAMPWNTPPITPDNQAGSLNPCNVFLGNNGPNGEATITCESTAPGTTNGVPLFSFCFQGAQWPIPVGTYNADWANQRSCGNYFVGYAQISGYGFSYAQLNSGSIVVALAQGGTWSTRAPMPTARWSAGSGVVNGIIYVMGGTTSVTSSGSDVAALEAYDPTSDTWSTKAPMPTPRHSFGVSVVNGILYTVGGYAFSCLCSVPTVEAYDPRTDTWTTKAPMPTARNGLVTGMVNGIIYAAGGNSPSSAYLNTLEAYDPVSDSWSTKTSMPTARYEPAAGVVDDVLYVAGGSQYGNLSTLEAYDPATDTWSTKPQMPTPRYYLGTGVLNELLYAVGGYNDQVALSAVEAYDPSIESWTAVTPMPTPRVPSVAVVDGTLYAIGGYDYVHGMPLSTVEALTPPTPGAAELSGGNSFNGNQAVNGTVSATGFVGNGSGLTGVNAQTASTAYALNCSGCIGNTQLGVNYAVGDTQGGSAVNALALGGYPVSAFAPSSGSANYVAKTGDTMTGPLNVPTDGLIAGGNEFVLAGGNVGIGTATPEVIPGYTSLHIDHSATGFGGSFLELTHSATGVKGRLVMDDNGFLLESVNGEPVKFKSGNFSNATDPGHIYITSSGNVGLGTGTPAATLEVNGTAKFDGTVTFAPGQTFPGSGGTITGVTAGTGLSGGGASGSVSLSVDSTVARTNASNTFSAPQTVSGAVTATSFTGSGAGLTNIPASNLTGAVPDANLPSDVARTGIANSFTNSQAISANSQYAALTVFNGAYAGVQATGGQYGIYASGAFGVYGVTTSPAGMGIQGVAPNSIGVQGATSTGVGVYGVSTAGAGTAGRFNAQNGGKILSGQNNNVEVFSVANNGSVNTSGSLATSGPVTIGGGTPIAEHLSMTFSLSVASLKPSTCTSSTFTLTGASDGDTTALGVPNALMSAGMIIYSAWVSAANTVTIRACNVNPNGPAAAAASGTVRVDIWKH